MPTARRTIVMIHPGGLGDVLLAVPAMVRLRTRFPSHQLVLCAEDQVARLLLACRVIDAWTSLHGRACTDLFAGASSVTGQVQTWLEDCDLAIGWMQDLDGKLNETLKAVGVREVIVRSPFSTAIRSTHQCDRFLEAINEAPFDEERRCSADGDRTASSVSDKPVLKRADLAIGRPFAVIHPGSGSAHKCVAPEILATVVIALQISGAIPVILEGPADREPVERLLQSCVTPPIVLQDLDVRHRRRGACSGTTLCRAGLRSYTYGGADGGTYGCDIWADRSGSLGTPRYPRYRVAGRTLSLPFMGEVSRCEEKPCLNVSQDHLVARCLAHLKEASVQ